MVAPLRAAGNAWIRGDSAAIRTILELLKNKIGIERC